MSNNQKKEVFSLGWLNPRNKKINQAGVAFFCPNYGEYFLKIDEESSEKQYFLKPFAMEQGKVVYRMELVIKDRQGKFLRRQVVGSGSSSDKPHSNVYVDYGSKFKTLVLFRKEKSNEQ